MIALTGIIFANNIQIFLFFRCGFIVQELQANLHLDVIEGHLLDLRDGEDGLAGRLVHGRHPTQATLVSGDLPHTQVHWIGAAQSNCFCNDKSNLWNGSLHRSKNSTFLSAGS